MIKGQSSKISFRVCTFIVLLSTVLGAVLYLVLGYNIPIAVYGDYQAQQVLEDSVVIDNRTNLMWEVKTHESSAVVAYSWVYALSYCETTLDDYAGYSDWRLPSVKELITIYDPNSDQFSLHIDSYFFPDAQLTVAYGSKYWSATSTGNGGYMGDAYYVDFINTAAVAATYNKQDSIFVRCVRG